MDVEGVEFGHDRPVLLVDDEVIHISSGRARTHPYVHRPPGRHRSTVCGGTTYASKARHNGAHVRPMKPIGNTVLPLVLILDADQTARDLYGDWFSSIGFQVASAAGTFGLRLALRSERPALIVTEISARDLTVMDLFARLQRDDSTRCIPVVLTSCCDHIVLNSAKRAGAALLLPKFTDFDCLRSWIDALVCPDLTD